MRILLIMTVVSALVLVVDGVHADTHYVSLAGGNTAPYTSWSTAATSIQDAVDAAVGGDIVLVTDGVYINGGASVYSMANRVALTNAVTLQSVNGPESTSIVGVGPTGITAVRCAYLSSGAVISGFTLSNGHTARSGDELTQRAGGGVWLDGGGTVTNCIISDNVADAHGGGVLCANGGLLVDCTISGNRAEIYGGGGHIEDSGLFRNCTISNNVSVLDGGGVRFNNGGTLESCTLILNRAAGPNAYGGGVMCSYGGALSKCLIRANRAGGHGGGAYLTGGVLNNCELSDNTARVYGGGAQLFFGGALSSCTLSDNSAGDEGGGVRCVSGGSLTNCILWGNAAAAGTNWFIFGSGHSFVKTCTYPAIGSNSVTNNPLFVDAAAGNYRLQLGSPCIDAGTNQAWMVGATDIAGFARIRDEIVDIGAYELPSNSITFPEIPAQAITNTVVLSASASSGLPVSFVVASGPGILTNDVYLTFSSTGSVSVVASQGGDGDWDPAPDVTNTFEVFIRPIVVITNPVDGLEVYGEVTSIAVSGTNNEAVVGMMSWENAANGANDTFSASELTFLAPNVPLSFGTNVISVQGGNGVGVVASDSISIVRSREYSEDGGDSPFHYVATNGTAVWPYTNWMTAAVSIQSALHTASGGDTVLVSNGVYSTGGVEINSLSNRVALTKPVVLQSVNGPHVTLIVGAADPGGGNGPSAVRCAYVTNGAVIAGFTLTNGHTLDGEGGNGGGVLLDYGGTLNNCMIISNSAVAGGGAHLASGGTLNNCMLSDNLANVYGAGAFLGPGGSLNNCTLRGNTSYSDGGGAYCGGGGTLNNCILWGNTAVESGDNWQEDASGDGSYTNICTTPLPTNGVNCVTNDPLFVAVDDYSLQSNSPCIDVGIALAGITDDIEGTPRPLNGDGIGAALPDIGAYEYSSLIYDTDSDLQTDYEEYIADTDGTDAGDFFRILELQAGVPATVRFQTSAQRQYTLWYSTNLVEGLWTAVAGQADIPGSGGENSLAHTNSLSPVFYQVEVELSE